MDNRLSVLRTGDTIRLADFYSLSGLAFDYHKHGNSPLHYSETIGKTVLEIYPLTKSQNEPVKYLRLGLSIDITEGVCYNLSILALFEVDIKTRKPIKIYILQAFDVFVC